MEIRVRANMQKGWLKKVAVPWKRLCQHNPGKLPYLQATGQVEEISLFSFTGHMATFYCYYQAGRYHLESCKFPLFETCDLLFTWSHLSPAPSQWREYFSSEDTSILQHLAICICLLKRYPSLAFHSFSNKGIFMCVLLEYT